jgi:hypothetical protein
MRVKHTRLTCTRAKTMAPERQVVGKTYRQEDRHSEGHDIHTIEQTDKLKDKQFIFYLPVLVAGFEPFTIRFL